ncbi:Uncharacterised protein [Segatella copri]|nr:Uncharacterised protein [Segatella copri]
MIYTLHFFRSSILLVSFSPCSNALDTGLLSSIVLLANLATFSTLMS